MNQRAPLHEPSFKTAIDYGVASAFSGMCTALPGIIESYDPEKGAVVRPAVVLQYPDGTTVDVPQLSGVPVVWPSCKNGSVTFPLERGDGVLLVFAQRSLDEYLTTGNEMAPADDRMFDINDAVAIPGLYPFSGTPTPANNTDFQISFKDQVIKIKPDGTIEIGGTGAEKLVTDAFMGVYNSHTHVSDGATTLMLMTAAHTTSKVKAQ